MCFSIFWYDIYNRCLNVLDILSYLCILDLRECFHCVALANIVVIVCESILTLRDMVAYAILGKKQ